jgi:RNA-directed DNA polymerase
VALRSRRAAERWEKAMSSKTHMHGGGESYCGIVPSKHPNEGRGGPKEDVEGRPWTEENAEQTHPGRTQSRESGTSGLERVREAAKRDRKMQFTALLHHVSVDLLRDSYHSLKKKAAPGVDGETWQAYGQGLEERLQDLHGRIHAERIERNRQDESIS